MIQNPNFAKPQDLSNMSRSASFMGYEVVDLAGFLDVIEAQAQSQRTELAELASRADAILRANTESRRALDDLTKTAIPPQTTCKPLPR